jgi:hypothetical protein
MSELKVKETFGFHKNNITLLSENEYATIAGSFVIVKQFKSQISKDYKILR